MTSLDAAGSARYAAPHAQLTAAHVADESADSNEAVKIIYIAGEGRSGSTLLGRLLGQREGVLAAGEVRYLWSRGLLEGQPCECGAPLPQCPFWERVIASAIADWTPVDAAVVVSMDRRAVRLRRTPLTAARHWNFRTGTRTTRYQAHLASVYEALRRVSGAGVIVDTSKVPSYALVLGAVPGIDLRVIHLVRDPRGTAHSWSRHKVDQRRGGAVPMRKHSVLVSALLWDTWNLLAEWLLTIKGRYLRVRYEDLLVAPDETVLRILEFADCQIPPQASVSSGRTWLRPGHIAWGNPDRFSSGEVHLKLDDEWLSSAPVHSKLLVTLLTWPLLLRYRYPLFPARPAPARS